MFFGSFNGLDGAILIDRIGFSVNSFSDPATAMPNSIINLASCPVLGTTRQFFAVFLYISAAE